VAEVLYVDRFGNLVTNLHAGDLRDRRVEAAACRGHLFPFHEHYTQVERGEPLALIGSFGFLELALREASVAQRLRLGVGTRVTVKFSGPPGGASAPLLVGRARAAADAAGGRWRVRK
jgi:hypothetical protein